MACGIKGFTRIHATPSGGVRAEEIRRFVDMFARTPQVWLEGTGLQVNDDGTVGVNPGTGMTAGPSGVGLNGITTIAQGDIT